MDWLGSYSDLLAIDSYIAWSTSNLQGSDRLLQKVYQKRAPSRVIWIVL